MPPRSTPPWMAAPIATTSSGFTPLFGSLPANRSFTSSFTLGMRDMPPTSKTSLISDAEMPASLMHARQGSLVRSRSGPTSFSSCARESDMAMCFGPEASAVMKGRLMSVLCAEDSRSWPSPRSRRRCTASHAVVDVGFLLERRGELVEQRGVKVLAAQERHCWSPSPRTPRPRSRGWTRRTSRRRGRTPRRGPPSCPRRTTARRRWAR